jgi:hypothetical protein
MKRLVALLPVLIALQVGVQPALAWTWPVDGPVLRPFVLGDDPYAAGQHRGIDIGAAAGSLVHSPAGGTVSFAGTVPGGGRTVTLRTGGGYAVTLLHLGSVAVSRGAVLAEGQVLGSVGPSGDAEFDRPYVHLGVRLSDDPNGYVDPLGFLPAPAVVVDPEEDPIPSDEPQPDSPEPEQPSAEDTPPQSPKVEDPASERQTGGQLRGSSRFASEILPTLAGRGRLAADRDRAATSSKRGRPALATAQVRLKTSRVFDRPLANSDVSRLGAATALDSGAVEAGSGLPGRPAALAAALALAIVAGLAVLGRKLRDAIPADPSSPVLLDRGGLAAEDAGGARLAEQDRLVFDRDLERILLGETESLPDLDRDDDPAELVHVPNDSRRFHSSCAHRRAHSTHIAWSGRSRARLPQAR